MQFIYVYNSKANLLSQSCIPLNQMYFINMLNCFFSVGFVTLCLKVCGPIVGISNYMYCILIGGCDLALVAIVNHTTFLFKFLNQN